MRSCFPVFPPKKWWPISRGVGEPLTGADPATSMWGTGAGRGPAERPLNAVLHKAPFSDYRRDPGPENRNWLADTQLDLRQYLCPSDRGYTNLHDAPWRDSGLSSYDHYGTRHAANVALCVTWVPGADGGQCRYTTFGPAIRPLSRIPNPGRTLAYVESAGLYAYAPGSPTRIEHHLYPLDWNGRPIPGWHRRDWVFNAAFVGGHAATTQIHGITWAPPTIPIPQLRADPRQPFRADIVTWRGAGWQLDALLALAWAALFPCSDASQDVPME